ncbi:MAG: hypothetical protein V3W34_19305 [Phycisphaerae bacterium]
MSNQTFRYYYLRLLAVSVACCVGLIGVGYLPTVHIAGAGAVTGMLLGVSVSLAASALGAIPVCLALGQGRDNAANAILAGMCLRFLVVLILVASLAFSGLVDRVVLVVWVAVSYLVLLLVDTLLSAASLRSLQGVSQ